MVYGNLFEQALGINTPWFISNIEFDADKKRIDIEINIWKKSTILVEIITKIGKKIGQIKNNRHNICRNKNFSLK